ncbi:MAG: hypothetical protein A3A73_05000 [Omnitrophica bacterium RIFCSPLOWO2_01_FULL_50_24]|nr:MAG: hypothetical protein A3A73_05000 [Omnitrophica bacterium RIFCSPLOWO2_01_FULL_50_24]
MIFLKSIPFFKETSLPGIVFLQSRKTGDGNKNTGETSAQSRLKLAVLRQTQDGEQSRTVANFNLHSTANPSNQF